MNKKQIITALAEKADITKTDAAKYFNAVMGIIADEMIEGEGEVAIPDFGRFYVKHMPERTGVNPSTGKKITIEAHDKVQFKPSDNMCYYVRKHCM